MLWGRHEVTVRGRWAWAAGAVLTLSCSDSAGDEEHAAMLEARVAGPPESAYDRERRVEISIELSSEDWERLRRDGRSTAQIFGFASRDYRYPEYFGAVTVDGVRYERVEVRKKGFIGSLSTQRPSLRLDFDPRDAGLASGLRRFTLNAGMQDRSRARECMAYDLFAAAGLPASRCGFAHVVVNGVDLGTYVNVEPVRGPMLRRFWPDSTGPLYEGTLADFDEATWRELELDSDAPTDHAELERLVAALEASDEALVQELEAIIDLAQFRDFWALETLLGHWDGYAENANNYYVFFDRQSERFKFIPWGLDQSFVGQRPFDINPYEITVYARAKLARRLYDVPEQRQLFRERLAALEETLWDEAALSAQVDAIERLVPDADAGALSAHREFLSTHGDELRAALAEPAPEIVDRIELPPPSCPTPDSPIQGSFSTYWGSDMGSAEIALSLDGEEVSTVFFPSAGPDANSGEATLNFFGPLEDGRALVLTLLMPRAQMAPGAYPFHGVETWGLLGGLDAQGAYTVLGFVGDGELRLERAGTGPSAPVIGSFEGISYQESCLNPGG